jgi:hypothetical protein
MTDEELISIMGRMMHPEERRDLKRAQSDRAHLLAEVERLRKLLTSMHTRSILGEAFAQLVSDEETERMFDSDPDPASDAVYWEITDRALRRFAVALGVDLDALVPE